MKKVLIFIIFALLCVSSVFATSPEIKFRTSNKEIEVQNFNNDKIICKDNVRFFNQTSSLIQLAVYGKKNADAMKEYLCTVIVKPNDSKQESCESGVGNYQYVYVQCTNGEATFSKITCENSDMYFYISDFKEKELSGFWGINWGTSIGESKSIISNKGNYELIEDNVDGIVYKGKFGGEDATICLGFFRNQLYRGIVIYPYEENKAISKYQDVKELITKKYGIPTKTIEQFQRPYYKGDGYEEQAIRTNKAFYASTWSFAENNMIMVAIGNSLETYLSYQNSKLAKENDEIEKEKNMEDF